MDERTTLHELVDQLPGSEIIAAERYLRFLVTQEEPPVEPQMLARIEAQRANPSPACIPHEEILREFGL